jgi:PAS domain S-box-containing protein
MHRLLKRQLKKLFGEITPNDESYQNLVDLIDDSYNQFQSDYNKLERILELSSKESFKELSNFKHAINSAALVSLTDLKGNILMANENFCKISGYSLGELIGNNHSIINSGFHEPEFWKNMWAQVSSGKIWHAEVCNRKKSGENYWVDSSIIPFLNDQGKPYQYLSIRFDITSRKKIEKEIKTLALVARKTQNAVIITDKDVKTIWTNEGFERITGYSFKEIEGKNPGHLLQGAESNPKTIKEMSEAFRNVKPYSGEIVNYTKTGKKYWIAVNITPIIENEEHIGFIAIESDITEKKEFELQLQENEEKFRLLIESATDIFYYTDSNGNFTYVNDIATQITGYTNQELLKMNYLDLVQPSHKNIVRQFYLEQAKKGQKVTYYEFPIVTKTGKNAWIGQNVQLYINKNERRGIQAIARDITSLKDAQLEIGNSHNFLNQIINSIPSPLFVKDSEQNWVMVNDAYAKLTNIPKNDILGNKDIDFLPIADAKIFMEQDDAQLQIGEEMVREVTFKNSNNEEKILLVKKSIFNNQGKNYLIGVITDITEFKERENQILLYNKISDQISDAISVADYQGNLIYVNETHAQNLGKTKKDIIQSNVLEVEKMRITMK